MKYLLIVLVCVTFSSAAFAASQVPFSSELSSKVKNYNRATPLLATSGAIDSAAINELAQKGITTIINLRTEGEGALKEQEQVEAAGMVYINIPVNGGSITDEEALVKLTDALDNISSPTLLHCGSGNRVGALLTRYYLVKGEPEEVAFEKGRTAGMKLGLEDKIKAMLLVE